MTVQRGRSKRPALLFVWGVCAAALLYGLSQPVGGVPPLGTLLDPWKGLYATARDAHHPREETLVLTPLDDTVTVIRDARGVPHLFAKSDRDAVVALGYVVAQDRLFQMDFLPRVAAGRLAEVFGPDLVPADRFLRETGMAWGARRNATRIRNEGGIEWDLVRWYGSGVNAYLDALEPADLPFEFRLLQYEPERYTSMTALLLLQYMNYDLSYRTDDAGYAVVKSRLGAEAYRKLYPQYADLFVPMVPGSEGSFSASQRRSGDVTGASAVLGRRARMQDAWAGTALAGYRPGKGSNNWAVHGRRSATGAPLLAGDMHLSLTLPSIWYEAHLVTPTMNVYGVTIPGAPVLVEAFNDYVGWTFTNTDADVVDHYRLTVDSSRTRYRFQGGYRNLTAVPDTIRVAGAPDVLDTLYYAHWGPVTFGQQGAVALQWTAHDSSRTLRALWGMHHARSHDELEEAMRYWDTPMQNVLSAGVDGTIAVRSTGYLPIRAAGHGMGLLDGSTDAFAWTGRVPFDELPHASNPAHGFLTSTNQQPADSTYPYYLRHDWRDAFRSLRIDTLLRRKPAHSVDDFKAYQADVHAVQYDLFVPLLDTLAGLRPRADTLRAMLRAWDGTTTVDRAEPLILDTFLRSLRELAWDEPAFAGTIRPNMTRLYLLLRDEPASPWLDVRATEERERASDLLRMALDASADTLEQVYGWGSANWRWGDHHHILFQHVTGSEALRPLWRGPVEYPGFANTLSPAGGRPTTKSASWRMIVDFSRQPPAGIGVYPGGQSGHPFSDLYDRHLPTYLAFEYYDLLKPATPEELGGGANLRRLTLEPE